MKSSEYFIFYCFFFPCSLLNIVDVRQFDKFVEYCLIYTVFLLQEFFSSSHLYIETNILDILESPFPNFLLCISMHPLFIQGSHSGLFIKYLIHYFQCPCYCVRHAIIDPNNFKKQEAMLNGILKQILEHEIILIIKIETYVIIILTLPNLKTCILNEILKIDKIRILVFLKLKILIMKVEWLAISQNFLKIII